MTRPSVSLTPIAEADLDDISDFIAADSPARALSFVRELRQRCDAIADHPEAYPLRAEYGIGIRITIHGRYLIFHRLRGDSLVIERIIQGNRHLEGMSL